MSKLKVRTRYAQIVKSIKGAAGRNRARGRAPKFDTFLINFHRQTKLNDWSVNEKLQNDGCEADGRRFVKYIHSAILTRRE